MRMDKENEAVDRRSASADALTQTTSKDVLDRNR